MFSEGPTSRRSDSLIIRPIEPVKRTVAELVLPKIMDIDDLQDFMPGEFKKEKYELKMG